MADSILTIGMVTRELMFQLENNLTFTKYVNRNYDDYYARTGAKIGDTLTIRLPPLFTVRTGRVHTPQDLQEQSVALVLNQQKGVDLDFTSTDLLLSLDDFSERFIKSNAAQLANEIDADGMALATKIANQVGTPGTVPNALKTYLDAGVRLSGEAVPRDGMRSMVVDEESEATIVDALSGLFHSTEEIERQYEQGNMGYSAGFKWSMDQNVSSYTVGAGAAAPGAVAGATQTGASLVTDGWAASTQVLNEGDVITIGDDVFGVNPRSKQAHRYLRQFVVTADVTSDGSGNATIPISPSITTTGAYQTVTKSPDDNDAIAVEGTANTLSRLNLAFHRDAFVLGMADMPMPAGTHQAERISDEQLGISIRMIWDYDAKNDEFIYRTDILYGWIVARQALACRVAA